MIGHTSWSIDQYSDGSLRPLLGICSWASQSARARSGAPADDQISAPPSEVSLLSRLSLSLPLPPLATRFLCLWLCRIHLCLSHFMSLVPAALLTISRIDPGSDCFFPVSPSPPTVLALTASLLFFSTSYHSCVVTRAVYYQVIHAIYLFLSFSDVVTPSIAP